VLSFIVSVINCCYMFYCLELRYTVMRLLKSDILYEDRSINKLQNGAIPSVLKIGKIRNICFVENLIMNIQTTFLDDDVIIVTSYGNRTQSICVLFSPMCNLHQFTIVTHK